MTSGEAGVLDIAAPFPTSQPAISKHLKVLEAAGLVSRRRQAKHNLCRLEAGRLKDAPKVVFSETMATADWADTRIASGDLVDEIKRLKDEPGGDLLAHGGARFARSLYQTELIDEFRLLVHPVVLGDGQRIFGEPMNLEPITTTAFSGGAVAHVCRPG